MSEKHIEPVHISCHYDIAPEIIFDAWTDPEMIRKWLFKNDASEITKVESDLKKEGSFSILESDRNTGETIDHYGSYKEIERPYRLVFTLNVPKQFTGETLVTVHLFPTLNGCELKLTQEGIPKEITEKSWIDMLHDLKHQLESK